MDRDEVLVFKTYDSDMDPFVPTMHSAFELLEQDGSRRMSRSWGVSDRALEDHMVWGSAPLITRAQGRTS